MNLPTEHNLFSLRTRMVIAYAVRSAFRVYPLCVMSPWFKQHHHHQAVLSEGLKLAVKFVQGEKVEPLSKWAAECGAAASAAAAGNAERAARAAAWSITWGVTAAGPDSESQMLTIDQILRGATQAADWAAKAAATTELSWSDYRFLIDFHAKSIDVSHRGPLGPVWPDGEPDWGLLLTED